MSGRSRSAQETSSVAGTQSIQRTTRILRELATADRTGLRLVDIAHRLGLEAPTAHRILKRLITEGFVAQRRDTKTYSLGPLIYELGLAAATRYDIRGACEETLAHLADASGDTIFLNVRSGSDAVCIARKEGWFPIKTLVYEVGSRRPLGIGAGGIALMLTLPSEEAHSIMSANEHRIVGYGTLTADIVRTSYEEAKAQGYCLLRDLAVPGTSAVAMPVRMDKGPAYAAISIVAISSRMSDYRAEELVDLLRGQVKALESLLNQR